MRGVKLVLLGTLLSTISTAVQSVPWWNGIGAAHGVRAMPLSLAQLSSGQFGRRDTERDEGERFPWRSLAQHDDDDDDKLHVRSRKLPPFSVLDADHDSAISQDEWTGYVNKLLNKAVGIINQGSDPMAKKYLLDIAKFHYDNLNDCIQAELLEVRTRPMSC